MKASLRLDPIIIDNTTGTINSIFSINLTDISVLVSGSDILDAFKNANGAVNFTINASKNIGQIIENIGTPTPPKTGSYSASAAPVSEPATMLLLGTSLLGLVAVGRRKFFKK